MDKFAIIFIFFVVGCTTPFEGSISKTLARYEEINFSDGISLEDAYVIAQRELIRQNVVSLYDFLNPKTMKDVKDLPNWQEHWFVFFDEKRVSHLPYKFIVIVNKETGRVKFADDFNEDKRWILEANLLRRN